MMTLEAATNRGLAYELVVLVVQHQVCRTLRLRVFLGEVKRVLGCLWPRHNACLIIRSIHCDRITGVKRKSVRILFNMQTQLLEILKIAWLFEYNEVFPPSEAIQVPGGVSHCE